MSTDLDDLRRLLGWLEARTLGLFERGNKRWRSAIEAAMRELAEARSAHERAKSEIQDLKTRLAGARKSLQRIEALRSESIDQSALQLGDAIATSRETLERIGREPT